MEARGKDANSVNKIRKKEKLEVRNVENVILYSEKYISKYLFRRDDLMGSFFSNVMKLHQGRQTPVWRKEILFGENVALECL